MGILESILLSLALAMDCFSIAFACGIIEKRFHASQAFVMALLFGAFQGLMPLIGWGVAGIFYRYIESFAPFVSFALLAFVGGKMAWESLHPEDGKSFNPGSIATLLYLAVVTSIDAMAIGVTFTCGGLETASQVAVPLAIIAAGSFVLALAGKYIGAVAGRRFSFNAELFGGIILILLGVKALVLG